MVNKEYKSILYQNIERGKKEGILSIDEATQKITYKAYRDFTVKITNPAEVVRASYFTQLVLDYKYPPEKIDFEVPTKPDMDRVDILVYKDQAMKEPYIVVECKKDGISDAEFNSAIEQAFCYANYKKSDYAVVVAGTTKATYLTNNFNAGEREDKVIADIIIKYGKAPNYKFVAGDKERELVTVTKKKQIEEELIEILW